MTTREIRKGTVLLQHTCAVRGRTCSAGAETRGYHCNTKCVLEHHKVEWVCAHIVCVYVFLQSPTLLEMETPCRT